MTREEAESLRDKAQPLLGKKVTIQRVVYTFKKTDAISCVGEGGKTVCKVNGTLVDANNNETIYPLSVIISAFG